MVETILIGIEKFGGDEYSNFISYMAEKSQFKTEGLAFGRTLQRAFKIAVLYSPDHSAAEVPLQQTYAALNSLLKQTREFTFGFVNQRVLLQNILTSDDSLAPLQAEFSKRGIGAVGFHAGIPFREFKRGLALLCTKPEVIEQSGGIKRLLKRTPIEGMRILAAEKSGSEKEDTLLEMDTQSYLMAQAILESKPGGASSPGLELLLQSAGMEKPAGFTGGAAEILELAGRATQAAWVDPESNPQEAIKALARVLEDLTPDSLIALLPASRQAELRGHSAQEIATELAEDAAAQWAAKRLSASPAGPAGMATEEEVARVLARAVKTTQVAERLLRKLTHFTEMANLPAEVSDRIRKELGWVALSREEKHAHLMGLTWFDDLEFRHLVEYIEEMGNQGHLAKATQVAEHYFALLDSVPPATRAEGLARVPELLRAVTSFQSLEFMNKVATRLCKELLDEPLHWECHRQVANCLPSAAQGAALYEDFETALKIGLYLERSLARDNTQHADCCGKALGNLLTAASVERLIELSLKKRDEAGVPRTVASLLRLAGAQGAEIAFQLLEEETAGPNRMRLLRLTGLLGPNAVEAARRRLGDERWFVARNACYVLGALDDPDLPSQLSQALCHSDTRVQQAAVNSILKSKAPGRGEALAKALPYLHPHLQETVLNELAFLKDPETANGLEEFIFRGSASKAGILEKAVRVLAATPRERAVEVLGKVLYETGQPLPVRKAALLALQGSPMDLAQQLLADFASLAPGDQLAADFKNASTPKAS